MDYAPAEYAPAQKIPLPAFPRDLVRANFSKFPNSLFDTNVLHVLNGTARFIYLDFVRQSIGHDRGEVKIGRNGLIRRTGFSETAIVSALKALAAAGLVVAVERDLSSSVNQERGTRYQVYIPAEALSDTPSKSAGAKRAGAGNGPIKERPKETHERAPAAVAPAIDVFGIRTIAARLFEAHRGELGFNHERLRQLVRDTLIGQGTAPDGDLIEEAIRGMAE